LFACSSIALECCKYARMRFHFATVLVVLSICTLRGNIADDAMQMDDKTLYPFYTTEEMPHVTGTVTKKRFVGSNSQVYSITTIYTVGYLQIFNAGHFENTNYDFILLSKQGRTQLIYSTELTTEHVFQNFGGGLPGSSPSNCGISQQDLSASLRNKSCKSLGSRPKRSMKPCYTNRTIK